MDSATITTAPASPTSSLQNAGELKARRSLKSNLGPLTTTFTPPNDCNSLLVRTIIETTGRYTQFYAGYGETCTLNDDGEASTIVPASCYPGALAGWHNDPDSDIPDRNDPIAYSPGLVCPVGYETACSLTRHRGGKTSVSSSNNDDYDLWNMLKDGETAIGCCPTNYVCKRDSVHICESTLIAPKTVTAVSYNSECEPSTLTTTIDLFWAALMDEKIAEAPRMILIHPEQTGAGPETTGSTSTSGNGPDEDAGDAGGSSRSNGLSTDVTIAIGVLIPVVVILFAVLLWFILRRKRANRQRTLGEESHSGASGVDGAIMKPELQGSSGPANVGSPVVIFGKSELEDSQTRVAGTGAVTTVGELDGNPTPNVVSELDSESTKRRPGGQGKA